MLQRVALFAVLHAILRHPTALVGDLPFADDVVLSGRLASSSTISPGARYAPSTPAPRRSGTPSNSLSDNRQVGTNSSSAGSLSLASSLPNGPRRAAPPPNFVHRRSSCRRRGGFYRLHLTLVVREGLDLDTAALCAGVSPSAMYLTSVDFFGLVA